MWQTKALIGAAGALVLWIGSCLYWHPPRIQATLHARSTEQLALAGLSEIQFELNGRDAFLLGSISSHVRGLEAERVVRSVRGIRTLKNRLTAVSEPEPEPIPSFLEIHSRSGRLSLRGPVPNENRRRELLTQARELVGADQVQEQLVVDSKVDDNDAMASAVAVLRVIAQTEYDVQVRFRGNSIRLEGSLASEEARRRVDEQVSAAARNVRTIFSALRVMNPDHRPPSATTAPEPPREKVD